jgi:hypothetical protein
MVGSRTLPEINREARGSPLKSGFLVRAWFNSSECDFSSTDRNGTMKTYPG